MMTVDHVQEFIAKIADHVSIDKQIEYITLLGSCLTRENVPDAEHYVYHNLVDR